MNNQIAHIEVDQNLTLETARKLGYVWCSDDVYDKELDGKDETNADLWKMVREGWKLGQPANPSSDKNAVGIYQPAHTFTLDSL